MAANVTDRIFDEINEYFSVHDLDGASACLEGWAKKMRAEGDYATELTVLNEMIGLYRKMLRVEDGNRVIKRADYLVAYLGLEDHMAGATTYLNSATACRAYRQFEDAEAFFHKTWAVYEKELKAPDYRLASYENNYALLLIDMGRDEEAEIWLRRAIDSLQGVPKSSGEIATTHMTLAQLYQKQDPEKSLYNERSDAEVREVMRILRNWTEGESSYYAYVCQSCGTALKANGRVEEGEELIKIGGDYYESQRNKG